MANGALAGQTFEEFYVDGWPLARRLAGSLTRNAALGEDIAHDVLVSMYRDWGSARRPEAYLRRAVANACQSAQRRDRIRRDKLSLLAPPDRVEFAADELSDVMLELSPRQRAVLVLRYRFQLSEREIAEVLGCRPGTVKSLASRALRRLSHELE